MTGYLQLLSDQFQWDISVMSNGWMYIPALIPIVAFLVFFFLKWVVLTAPVWLPFSLVINAFRK